MAEGVYVLKFRKCYIIWCWYWLVISIQIHGYNLHIGNGHRYRKLISFMLPIKRWIVYSVLNIWKIILSLAKCIDNLGLVYFSLAKHKWLTHWGRVTHICVGERTNAVILLIGPYGTNYSEILIQILTFSFTKMSLKVSSAKWRLFGLGLNELNTVCIYGTWN